ncbi:hypothetical protein D3C85_1650700 [compost metagenome]
MSTNRGTVTVTPSRASPGECRYWATQSTPPSLMTLGNACVVMPAASWRISSSRVRRSRSLFSRLAFWNQRSNVAPLNTSCGSCWS